MVNRIIAFGIGCMLTIHFGTRLIKGYEKSKEEKVTSAIAIICGVGMMIIPFVLVEV